MSPHENLFKDWQYSQVKTITQWHLLNICCLRLYFYDFFVSLQRELSIFSMELVQKYLRCISGLADNCGIDCIHETFRVLKDNEIRQYGKYRTKRLVLEAWNRFGYNN